MRTQRFVAIASSLLLSLALVVPAAAVPTGSPTVSVLASAGDPDSVSFTLEGCRLPAGSALPATLICADSQYTTGNLGKSWNELDLVPHRLTARANTSAPSSQTYTVAVAADSMDASHPGYDVMTAPAINAAKSDASCAIADDAQATLSPGVGGTDESIYRLLHITQNAGTTCVFDWVERLALGSHLFPGSSLHSDLLNQNLTTSGIGAKDVSIPVKEILPQELSKDMSASEGASNIWNVVKTATPASLDFGDTCRTGASFSAGVRVTVRWTKTTSLSDITIVTNVYATNPAHRSVDVSVTDVIYSGTTALDTTTGAITVAPNSTALVLTHTTSAPVGSTDLNDIATATYTDTLLGIPVPGNTTATASATVQLLTGTNDTAVITDTESITGDGLSFSVTTPSVGSLLSPYVAGTSTTGPVNWSSGTVSGDGSVTFEKLVHLDQSRITSGSLVDTATVTGSDGFTKSASLSVDISSSATVSLSISKTIPAILQTGESQSFSFDVTGPNLYATTQTISFGAGETNKSVTLTGLEPGSYTITEQTASGWAARPPQTAAIDLPTCSGGVTFVNVNQPAHAQARKVTDPAGNEAGWVLTLTGPGAVGGLSVTTDGTGYKTFPLDLREGTYTITETQQSGFDQTGPVGGSCSFTVNYPADDGALFSCTFTNTQKGHARVVKTVSGAAPTGSQAFIFQLRQGATTTTVGTILESVVANAGNGGTVSFSTLLTANATYQMCEIVMPGWLTSLGTFVPNSFMPPDGVAANPAVDNSILCVNFSVSPGATQTFTVDNTPPPGGRALTIGFWKNWASCASSNGKQKPVLDQTLSDAGSISIGNLVLHGGPTRDASVDCAKAVAILNKTDIVTGKKMSSDPAYNLAAQLLAADLNFAAAAGKCGAAITAVSQAQALLQAINFTGTGSYTSKMTAAQIAQANSLATTLDNYNNDRLC